MTSLMVFRFVASVFLVTSIGLWVGGEVALALWFAALGLLNVVFALLEKNRP